MVALDEYVHHNGTKTRSWRFATSISPGFQNRPLLIDHCSLIFGQGADAYGNTLIFTAPDTTGNWWGDGAVQASYGANEIIYCGYRFDPETQVYYVRYRTYNPALGRWIQRDPVGYEGGINLYGYVGGRAAGAMDTTGRRWFWGGGSVPKPTGNSGNDAQEYLDLLKDKGKEVAEEFLKEAAKQYAQDGDSDSLANSLEQLAKTAGKAFQKALMSAGEAALKKGLETLSKDLGKEVGAIQQGLAAFAGNPYCRNWYTQTYKDIEAAKHGNRGGCSQINSGNNTNFSGCYNALLTSGFDAAPVALAFRKLAKLLALKCNRCKPPSTEK